MPQCMCRDTTFVPAELSYKFGDAALDCRFANRDIGRWSLGMFFAFGWEEPDRVAMG